MSRWQIKLQVYMSEIKEIEFSLNLVDAALGIGDTTDQMMTPQVFFSAT